MRRGRFTLLLVLIWLGLVASPARAALFMEFEPPEARPGKIVHGRTIGEGAFAVGPGRAFPAWLVPVGDGDRTLVGHVRVGARGNGTLTFEVPDVPGGTYEVVMSCAPCAPYSAGRTEVPVGELLVLGPRPPVAVETSRDPFPAIVVLAAGCLLVGGVVLRRRSTSVSTRRQSP
jgi:hypothetical protein